VVLVVVPDIAELCPFHYKVVVVVDVVVVAVAVATGNALFSNQLAASLGPSGVTVAMATAALVR